MGAFQMRTVVECTSPDIRSSYLRTAAHHLLLQAGSPRLLSGDIYHALRHLRVLVLLQRIFRSLGILLWVPVEPN